VLLSEQRLNLITFIWRPKGQRQTLGYEGRPPSSSLVVTWLDSTPFSLSVLSQAVSATIVTRHEKHEWKSGYTDRNKIWNSPAKCADQHRGSTSFVFSVWEVSFPGQTGVT